LRCGTGDACSHPVARRHVHFVPHAFTPGNSAEFRVQGLEFRVQGPGSRV